MGAFGVIVLWEKKKGRTECKPNGTACCKMLKEPCRWIWIRSPSVSPEKKTYTVTPPPPCFAVGTTHPGTVCSSSHCLTNTHLDLSGQRTVNWHSKAHYEGTQYYQLTPVMVVCAPNNTFDIQPKICCVLWREYVCPNFWLVVYFMTPRNIH